MPLPPGGPDVDWPPKDLRDALDLYDKWGAWWSGDTNALTKVYQTTIGYIGDPQRDTQRGQITGVSSLARVLPRTFWGTPPSPGSLRSTKLHVPLAADIAMVSADLLFAEAPTFSIPGRDAGDKDDPTQQRIETLIEDGLISTLVEAAETAAAYGGVYLRVNWDTQVADHAFLDAIPPDAAVPEFRSGRLVAVTFWRQLPDLRDGRSYKHLERHETGAIFHGLYQSGDASQLGVRVDLKQHPATEIWAGQVGEDGRLDTGAPAGLTAAYFPNMRPNRRLRGSALGRSDFDAAESMLDALDEAWTSWMRDLRLAKARLMVPDVYMHNQGAGKGSVFDADQEVYQSVNALPGAGDHLAMQQVQFAIRVDEHERTTTALAYQAIRSAGYSVQTFGESGDTAVTATEVVARERRSYTTRSKKVAYVKPEVARIMEVLLQVDVAQFHPRGVTPLRPVIEFPDGVSIDPQTQAQTLQLLAAASALSTRTKVQMLHPEWDDERVDKEVQAIRSETAPPAGPGGEPGAGSDGFPHAGTLPAEPADIPAPVPEQPRSAPRPAGVRRPVSRGRVAR